MKRLNKKRARRSLLPVQAQKNNADVLREYAFWSTEKLFQKLQTDWNGLAHDEAQMRHEKHGSNIIVTEKPSTRFTRLMEAVINPFNVVLLAIAIITFITDVVLASKPDYITTGIILILVFLSSLVAFIQNERSNAAAFALSKMISNKVHVFREGKLTEILLEEVVVGDIIKLSAGDIIPADVRFLATKDAFLAQAALTGESNPVEKFSDIPSDSKTALTDLSNIGFMGSNMVSGTATAVVLAISNDTYFGSMAKSLSGDRAKNSFERGVDSLSSLLIRFMLVMVPVVLLINGVMKKDWFGSLLFAISIAVGLTPEMLPVIMTSTLARGAMNMSKHDVIVKNLGSIQAFGEMDILCTDKTGTLTEDKIILEKYMDIHGNDDVRILRHAYLNSYFQTGLKNLIDQAVIQRATEYGLDDRLKLYTKIDEIPFDFSRRRMSVVLRDTNGKRQLITKGAVEEMLEICSHIEYHGAIVPLDAQSKEMAMQTYEMHNRDGLRVLAVAQKNYVPDIDTFSVKHENDMVLLGFIAFLDPPKESAAAAVSALTEHGVRVVVLTGDSEGVAVKVCGKIGIPTKGCLTGQEISQMDDAKLQQVVQTCDLFSKLSPMEKKRIIQAFQAQGHTVGYMGDGINDALSLQQADVGISVDSAVDIAKETADIVLLKKDLTVLEEGVIEGRKTFGNIIKYIKMAVSGNFSNMISVVAASLLLPFLPMLPAQILIQNLLCDFAQMGMPFDRVDESYVQKPRKWDIQAIRRFMFIMGPLGSIFDLLCFSIMWWVIGANTVASAPLFHGGWFLFGTISQIVVIHMIRTAKRPFLESNASVPLFASTILVSGLALLIGFTDIAIGLDMLRLPLTFLPWLIVLLAGYCLAIQWVKRMYCKRYQEWL